jgi:hypothetical protein
VTCTRSRGGHVSQMDSVEYCTPIEAPSARSGTRSRSCRRLTDSAASSCAVSMRVSPESSFTATTGACGEIRTM